MNFLEFVSKRKENEQNRVIIKEGFKNSDLGKAQKLILKMLRKNTGETIISLGNFELQIGKEDCTSELFVCAKSKNPICFTLNWLNDGKSSQIYSISFFKNMNVFFDGRGKSDLTIESFGCSVAYLIPIISYIVNTGDFNLQKNDATKFVKALFGTKVQEGRMYECYIGALRYYIIENVKESLIKETFMQNIKEGSYEDLLKWKKEKMATAKEADSHKKDSPEASRLSKDLWKEYEEIKNAIKGGASSIEEVQLALQKSVNVVVKDIEGSSKIEEEINKIKKDPEQVFKEMRKYVKMVIKGITPSVILCGAPGVGKTFKVKQELKAAGYHEGHNLCTIKGKCTPRVLYTTLLDYKNKGDIVVIDDADGLVGPKAPEDCINILKAALDSTEDDEGRLVSYGVSGIIRDEEGMELPKRFYYNGGCIVITNYNAGQLDTALRGRSFIQDIHFSVDEVLQIIKKLLPELDPEHLSPKAKMQAYEYLVKLNEQKSKMEISLRTFGICAKIFEACNDDSDFSDEDAESMVTEQMKLQADRGGKKY